MGSEFTYPCTLGLGLQPPGNHCSCATICKNHYPLATTSGQETPAAYDCQRRLHRLFMCAALTLFLLTLFLTYTRSAMLSFIVSTTLLFGFLPQIWKKLAVVGSIAIVVLYSMFPTTITRLKSLQDPSASFDRAIIWSTALNVINDHPMGIGLGNYPKLIRAYYKKMGAPESLVKTYAHKMLLSAWAETGAAGVMLFVLVWIYFFVYCFKTWKKTQEINSTQKTDEEW